MQTTKTHVPSVPPSPTSQPPGPPEDHTVTPLT
ncbi:WhiB family transcriptional regulator, partial [Streptomyces sp. SID11233]|nr:WhiB family transcriptional regulator [Streptomyces sp. SID11233]